MPQKLTSAGTSLNQIPAGHKKLTKVGVWSRLERLHQDRRIINVDLGGGAYNTATLWVEDQHQRLHNLVIDPFNRSEAHNEGMRQLALACGGADTVTLHNVLNVIDSRPARVAVLRQAKALLRSGGTIYITVYEGNGSGIPQETTKGWQENRKLRSYTDEIIQALGALPHTIRSLPGVLCVSCIKH